MIHPEDSLRNIYVRYAFNITEANQMIVTEESVHHGTTIALVKRTKDRIISKNGEFICMLVHDSLPLHEVNHPYLPSTNLATNPED